eukprot:SAG22_NODE_641_length_8235_cov_9.502704_7_plen_158_part_00
MHALRLGLVVVKGGQHPECIEPMTTTIFACDVCNAPAPHTGTLLFIKAPTPALACLCSCGVQLGGCLNGSGYSPNYLEVGGPDTALMYAVGNAIASIPGLALPPLGLALLRVSGGSWMPLFGGCAAFTLGTGVWFHQVASLRNGRELLAERSRERGK